MIAQHDDKTIRCPRVGGPVNFKFCRSENNHYPCRWIIGCWHRTLDIHAFVEENYTEEEQRAFFLPPRPKMESLLDLVEKAKRAGRESEKGKDASK